MKTDHQVKFPLLKTKYSLATTVVTGILSALIIVWLHLTGGVFCGSALLVLCLLAYLLFAGEWSPGEIRYVILVFVVGTALIVVAEKNKVMMGIFSMGAGLGPFLGPVGLLCGLLVALPVLFSFPLAARMSNSIYGRSLIGAIMVTVPAALIFFNGEVLHFFTWFKLIPSTAAFFLWFVVSFFLHFTGHQLQVKMENPMARTLYVIWIGAQVVITVLRFAF